MENNSIERLSYRDVNKQGMLGGIGRVIDPATPCELSTLSFEDSGGRLWLATSRRVAMPFVFFFLPDFLE